MFCKKSVKMIFYLHSSMKNLVQYSLDASRAHHKYLLFLLFHQFIPRTQKYCAPFVGAVTLLLMPHTMTWAFIRQVPSKTACFTKTLRMSSATTVIPANKSSLVLSFSLHLQVMRFTAFLLLYFQGWYLSIHETKRRVVATTWFPLLFR